MQFKREIKNEAQKVDRTNFAGVQATPPPTDETPYKYSTFEDLRRSSGFVDKTLLIKRLLGPEPPDHPHLYITAPALFGKTLNLDMLDRFLRLQRTSTGELIRHPASNYTGLFLGTNIFTQKDFFRTHFGQHIVLRLSLLPLHNITIYGDFKDMLCSIISDAEWQIDVMAGKTSDKKMTSLAYYYDHCKRNFRFAAEILPPRLKHLSETLGKKAVLLWDDLDMLPRILVTREIPDLKSVHKTIRAFVAGLLSCDDVSMSVSVGRLSIGGVLSSLPNCTHISFNENGTFAPFFGLTGREVNDLVEAYRLPFRNKIELYYNGYEVLDSDLRLYNPFSITSLVGSKKLDFYWQKQAASLFPFMKLFSSPLIGTQIATSVFAKWIATPRGIAPPADAPYASVKKLQAQLGKGSPKIEATDRDLFMSYLLQTGFYTVGSQSKGAKMRLANLETVVPTMAQLFLSGYYELYYQYTSNAKVIFLAAMAKLAPAQGTYDRLAMAIHNLYHYSCPKLVDQRPGLLGNFVAIFSSPQAVHAGVADVVYGKRVPLDKSKVNRKGAFGSIDLVVTFGNHTSQRLGLVMELVLWKSAELAMTQLETFDYLQAFDDLPDGMRPHNVVLLGINLDKQCKCTVRYKYGKDSSGEASFPKTPS